MVKKAKLRVSLIVLFTFCFGIVGQAYANTESINEREETDSLKYQHIVTELNKLMKVVDNQFVLNLDSDDLNRIGLSEKEYKDIQNGLKDTNKYIKKNDLIIQPDLSIKDPNAPINVLGGVNKTVWTWYGWQLFMDSDTTDEVVDKISWGQTALLIGAYMASKIPGAAAIVVEAVILGEIVLAIGTAALNDANDGNGVIVHVWQPTHIIITGVSDATPFWVSSQ